MIPLLLSHTRKKKKKEFQYISPKNAVTTRGFLRTAAQPDPWAPLPSSQTNGVASQNGMTNEPPSIDDAFDLLSNRPTASTPGKGATATTNNGLSDLDIFGSFKL